MSIAARMIETGSAAAAVIAKHPHTRALAAAAAVSSVSPPCRWIAGAERRACATFGCTPWCLIVALPFTMPVSAFFFLQVLGAVVE
jgi:hypothetical protein